MNATTRTDSICAALTEYVMTPCAPCALAVIDNDDDCALYDLTQGLVTSRYLFTFDRDDNVLTCHSADDGCTMQLLFHYDAARTLHTTDAE